MGIAKFYSWLRNKNFRGVLQRYVPQNVSSFSFDLNGLIHGVAQTVYAYGNGEDPVRKKLIEKMDPRELEAEFHLALGAKISEVIAAVQPRDTLVLAVDGVAPQAKIAQQRQRRFRSAMDSPEKSVFNNSAITPGTEFMKRLDNYIQRWIIGAKNALPPKVIYSSHMVPGEGEHKIFALMREGEIVGEGSHVVYGMDADLIMLSMLAPLEHVFLVREDLRDVIDIDNFKTAIRDELRRETAIEDFVIMIFLLGNDFLPHLPTLNDMEEAIETMIRIYNIANVSLSVKKEINWNGFNKFLSEMSLEEPRLLELESEREVKHVSKMMDYATSKSEMIGVNKLGGKIVKQSRFDLNKFRAAWYDNNFGLKGPKANEIFSKLVPNFKFGVTNSKVVEMTKSYLTGIAWVFRYYGSGKDFINNDYVYRYLYAPLISDISAVSKQYQVPLESYDHNPNAIEINPVHQLLSVLPLKSKELLPHEVKHLMNKDSMIGDYFSEKQILDRQGYNTDWQGTLLINFVNMKRIQEAVEKTSVFTPDRIREFSPVKTVILVKDQATIEMDERARKFKSYLNKSQGRGRGSYSGRGGDRSDYRKQGGRGYSGRGSTGRGRGQERGYSGRGSTGRGRGQERGSTGRGFTKNDNQQKVNLPPPSRISSIPQNIKPLAVQKFEL